jgi:Flp pilus assembly pilin Flp
VANLISRLWNDDQGAIISVEWLLIVSVLIFGLIPGLVALRNGIDSAMATVANILTQVLPSFTFSGYTLGQASNPIASVGGWAFSPNSAQTFTSAAVTPVQILTTVTVDPAP